MKFAKCISLFFIYPLAVFLLGFWSGIQTIHFFYPGMSGKEQVQQETSRREEEMGEALILESTAEESVRKVAAVEETLNADTEYVVQERDLLRNSVVETVWQIPGKYIGMNRQLFVDAMEEYMTNPPLSEKERGFVGLEVLSFSPERVVVQMNYEYVQPSASFYLAVRENEVVVLLEDMETIFINTGIRLENLPELVQMKVIQMYYIEDEERLYNFLETYSS